jgi:hypothetical protein
MCSTGKKKSCLEADFQIMEWIKYSELKGAANFDPMFIQMILQSSSSSADVLTSALLHNKKNVEGIVLILSLINKCLEISDRFADMLNSRNILGVLNTVCLINFESMNDKDQTSIDFTKKVCSLIQKLVNVNLQTYTLIQLAKHIVKLIAK